MHSVMLLLKIPLLLLQKHKINVPFAEHYKTNVSGRYEGSIGRTFASHSEELILVMPQNSFFFFKNLSFKTWSGFYNISVPRWSIYIINSVDKPNFRVSLPHRRSTTVSLETNPLYINIYIRFALSIFELPFNFFIKMPMIISLCIFQKRFFDFEFL